VSENHLAPLLVAHEPESWPPLSATPASSIPAKRSSTAPPSSSILSSPTAPPITTTIGVVLNFFPSSHPFSSFPS